MLSSMSMNHAATSRNTLADEEQLTRRNNMKKILLTISVIMFTTANLFAGPIIGGGLQPPVKIANQTDNNGGSITNLSATAINTAVPNIVTNNGVGYNLDAMTTSMGSVIASNTVANAGWVRGLIPVYGSVSWYVSTNVATVGFSTNCYSYMDVIPESATRSYVITSNGYIGANITTNTYTTINSPILVDSILGMSGPAAAVTIQPEIYFTTDGTNLVGDYAGASQALVNNQTNQYSWIINFPTYTSSVPARIVRRIKVISNSGTPTVFFKAGTNINGTASHIVVSTPTASGLTAPVLLATQSDNNGGSITNISATNITSGTLPMGRLTTVGTGIVNSVLSTDGAGNRFWTNEPKNIWVDTLPVLTNTITNTSMTITAPTPGSYIACGWRSIITQRCPAGKDGGNRLGIIVNGDQQTTSYAGSGATMYNVSSISGWGTSVPSSTNMFFLDYSGTFGCTSAIYYVDVRFEPIASYIKITGSAYSKSQVASVYNASTIFQGFYLGGNVLTNWTILDATSAGVQLFGRQWASNSVTDPCFFIPEIKR